MRVVLSVETPADVLSRVYPNGKRGGLTVDGLAPGALGDTVEVDVQVRSPRRTFLVRGQLAWVRHRAARTQKESFGLEFFESDDASTERLLQFARNELDETAMRAEPRVATDIPVSLFHQGELRKEFLADLSAGGAFVRSAAPLLPGETVQLQLRAPLLIALFPIKLRGRVAWVRRTGTATGMGLEFSFDDPAAHGKLERLVAKLAS